MAISLLPNLSAWFDNDFNLPVGMVLLDDEGNTYRARTVHMGMQGDKSQDFTLTGIDGMSGIHFSWQALPSSCVVVWAPAEACDV